MVTNSKSSLLLYLLLWLWSVVHLSYFSPQCQAQQESIEVIAVSGQVWANKQRIKAGDTLNPGVTVETAENSGCRLRLKDRTVIDLAAASVFKVDAVRSVHGKPSVLELSNGAVKVSTAPKTVPASDPDTSKRTKVYLKTKWSVIGVRGTRFIASNDPPLVATLSGMIEVATRESLVKPLVQGQWASWGSDGKLLIQTFSLQNPTITALYSRFVDWMTTYRTVPSPENRAPASLKVLQQNPTAFLPLNFNLSSNNPFNNSTLVWVQAKLPASR